MLRYHLFEFSYWLRSGALKVGNKVLPLFSSVQGIVPTMKRKKKGTENQINVMKWKLTSAPFIHQDLHHLVVEPAPPVSFSSSPT